MRRFVGQGALVLCLLGAASAALAAPKTTATEAVHAANDRLRSLLEDKTTDDRTVSRELRSLFDISTLSERALADHWAKLTPKKQTELVNTLQAIIEKNYLTQLRGNLAYQIDYLGETPSGEDVLVQTIIRAQRNGRPTKISVDYRLHATGDRWRIFDVMTEGVSILHNYRSQFNRIIAKEGVDGLLARMKSKLDMGGG